MRFLKEFWLGIQSYYQAIQFIRTHKLWWFAIIPAISMLIIYYLGYLLLNRQINYDFSNMNGIVWYCLISLLEILLALTLMKFTKYIVVIMLAPLLSFLSQKCESLIGTPNVALSWKDFKNDIMRSVRLSIRNLFWEYSIFVLILIIAFVGWSEPRSSPIFYLSFIISFYFYGFSFLDYHNERIRRNAEDSVAYIRHHNGLAMGIGIVYSLLILMPINLDYLFVTDPESFSSWENWKNFLLHLCLWIAASFAPILAIVSSTIASNQLEKEYEKKLAIESLETYD